MRPAWREGARVANRRRGSPGRWIEDLVAVVVNPLHTHELQLVVVAQPLGREAVRHWAKPSIAELRTCASTLLLAFAKGFEQVRNLFASLWGPTIQVRTFGGPRSRTRHTVGVFSP
jgi:hypothetical protein